MPAPKESPTTLTDVLIRSLQKKEKAELNVMRGEKVVHGSPVYGTVTAFVSGNLRYPLNGEMGAFKEMGEVCFPKGLVHIGMMYKLPCPSCYFSWSLAKNVC